MLIGWTRSLAYGTVIAQSNTGRIKTDASRRLLDSLHLVLISYTIYFYAVTNFSNIFAMLEATWYVNLYIRRLNA